MAKKLDRLYIRVDALFHRDERYLSMPYVLRDSAYCLFELLNGWSRDKKTDGRVPVAAAFSTGLGMEHPRRRVAAMLEALCAVGLLVREGDDLVIPKYAKWQDTREEMEHRSEAKARAGQAGGVASGRSRREAGASKQGTTGEAEPEANPKQNEALETETETETVVASIEATSSPPPAEPERADVEQLCRAMADSLVERDEPRPRITAEWRKQARLLLDNDHRPLDEALALIAWLTQDQFWSPNVRSIPKFREKYGQLRGHRQRDPNRPTASRPAAAPRHQLDADARAAYAAASRSVLPS